ncbi:hypothetical protein FN846DRAFT_911341 [Sphaerosporella brunnea]|uniref:Uncharacterized protein n=1 Tax=Sphaerosporella brunnea TaxID=1250544 RepID=A0A5J5EKS4_9PEZI|nr:hypothetical protein FN846DRAFT_911341 [Sphaerosporella brunnea]
MSAAPALRQSRGAIRLIPTLPSPFHRFALHRLLRLPLSSFAAAHQIARYRSVAATYGLAALDSYIACFHVLIPPFCRSLDHGISATTTPGRQLVLAHAFLAYSSSLFDPPMSSVLAPSSIPRLYILVRAGC